MVIFKFQSHLFLQNIICITPDLKIKKLFKNVNIMKTQILHNMKYEFQSHIRPLLCQNPSSTFVYGLILLKILMNANINYHEDTIIS